MNGAETAKNTEPIEMKVESPEEQLEVMLRDILSSVYTSLLFIFHSLNQIKQGAISKIDKLEAEKTHYKYDMHSVQNSFSQ